MSDPLRDQRVAILGFGNQGAAHAALLRAAGVDVIVGARPGPGAERAKRQNFTVLAPSAALERAGVAALLLPDEALPSAWPALRQHARGGQCFVFAHGFNLLYRGVDIPDDCDVVLVSPTAPGFVLAQARERGERIPAYVAVHHDTSGQAWDLALGYADRLHCGPLLRTTVREETEVDLFGEQVVLCGGMNALVLAAFETLVSRGYTAEVAYLECVHQLRYLAELLQARGPAGFRAGVSGTARYGDLTRGPRVIGPESRAEIGRILDEIRDGSFAREWRAEVAAGSPRLKSMEAAAATHPIEAARASALVPKDEPPVPGA